MYKICLLIFLVFICSSCSSSKQKDDSIHPNKENFLPEDQIDTYLSEKGPALLADTSSLELYSEIGDNEENMLGKTTAAKLINSSQIAVLDNSLNKLKVFDSQTGKLHAVFAREGRGPGELIQPTAMEVAGNNIIVSDRMLKLSSYVVKHDSISFRDEVNIKYTPNKICAIDNFVFVSGMSLESDYTIFKYDLNTLESLGQFHETYKSDNPLVSMMLSNNLISCNSNTGSVLVATPYLPYIYSYDTEGNLKWISEVEEFYPRTATEQADGSLKHSFNKDGFTDRYLNFHDQQGSDFNFLQIIRTEMNNGEILENHVLTYRIDSGSGEGQLASDEVFRILSLTNDYLILFNNEEFPTVNLFKNPFNEL